MKVPYVCCSKKFEEHYTNQSGSGIPHYEGISFQRGYGLGGVFRRLFRAALPFLVRGGKVVGKEALVTGTKVINDVLSGKDLETAAKSRRSPECVKSELELFHLPATQTAIEDGHWVEFHPLSNVFDGGPVEFHISGSGEEYVDLSQTQLYVKAKIVKADGKPLEKDEKKLVLKVRVSPGVILGHAKALENGTAKYPLNRVLCKVYSVPQGSMSFVQDNIFVGQMPKRIIVGCVDNDAFHDESSEPGSHWLAFYCENGCIEFFDSFGNPPDFYDPRFHEITLRYPSVCWNSTPLQNLTSNHAAWTDQSDPDFCACTVFAIDETAAVRRKEPNIHGAFLQKQVSDSIITLMSDILGWQAKTPSDLSSFVYHYSSSLNAVHV
ncbi:uncharacterized protein F54H12.2 [Caerostris extrusa]|uniref:Uncharacterized protein F54H12.2 n=1 Tax=Caerostris extrusa TaxID=172846 RepID=A0AAV4XHH0_CAEEX|nr:uncharacterized protein F54H12.2 [Caerostris extrusa]